MVSDTNNREIVMPERYTELSTDEMEYDGGWLNFAAGIGLTIAGVVLDATGHEKAALACTAVGAILTIGTFALTTKAVMKGTETFAKLAAPKIWQTASGESRALQYIYDFSLGFGNVAYGGIRATMSK